MPGHRLVEQRPHPGLTRHVGRTRVEPEISMIGRQPLQRLGPPAGQHHRPALSGQG